VKISNSSDYIPFHDPKEAARHLPPQEKGTAVPRVLGGPIGASVYRVALQGGQPAVADSGGPKIHGDHAGRQQDGGGKHRPQGQDRHGRGVALHRWQETA
jgi:hypothetical protein